MNLAAPFPYFGGKGRVAAEVWSRFGDCDGYLEPFIGSAAMALKAPGWRLFKSETWNDKDGMVCNFWRSAAWHPERVAAAADWPVNQCDLKARHDWLNDKRESLAAQLADDPEFCDPEIAGVWLWGICQWIGSGWVDGKAHKKRPHLGNHGRGAHSLGQRPHLGNHGMGAHSLGQRPHLGDHSMGGIYETMRQLAERLRFVRVTCCDWASLKSTLHAACSRWGVFLDPPYTAESGRCADLYTSSGDGHLSLGHEVAAWARELAETRPDVRVALCGIDGEYEMPGWDVWAWKTKGYSYGGRERGEVIWFSPSCGGQGALL